MVYFLFLAYDKEVIFKRQLNLKQLVCVDYYTEHLFQQNGIWNYTKLYKD